MTRNAALLALLCLLPAGAPAARRGSVPDKADPARIAAMEAANLERVRRLVDAAGIEPGMTVLDLGAGTGQEAFEIAARLKGKGTVFAAEVEPELVEYIAAEAGRRGLSSARAVLVRKGFDGFYAKRRFDRIVLYDATGYRYDQAGLLPELARSLAAGGRVVLGANDGRDLSFYPEDLRDADGLLAELKREPLDSPFGRELRAPIQGMLDAFPGRRDPLLARAALFHMNRVLEGRFYAYFTQGARFKAGLAFTPEEERYASWLLGKLLLAGIDEERGFINKRLGTLSDLQRLNKLLLIQRFRSRLVDGGERPYLSAAPEAAWERDYAPPFRGLRLERREVFAPFQSIRVYRAE